MDVLLAIIAYNISIMYFEVYVIKIFPIFTDFNHFRVYFDEP